LTLRRQATEARLRRLADVVRRLRRLRAAGAERFRSDEDLQWLVERGLQLGCEIVLDVGNHILSGAFGRPSETYAEILEGLAREAVIERSLYEELRGLGGLRNVLVHAYLDLDPLRIWQALETAPERFERFAGEAAGWLESEKGGPEC
jgi:uncharacterized protein YutE (UPF0331/DUF86 family)